MRYAITEAFRTGFVTERYTSFCRRVVGLAFPQAIILSSGGHNELNIVCEQYRG